MDSKELIVAIHQPNYIPWLGLFYKIYQSDIFVFHDDVQFSKKGMHNFHYIKTKDDHFRLKIPVEQNHGDKINEVRTRDELGWKKSHLKKLEESYKNAPFFRDIYHDFEFLIEPPCDNLSKLNIKITEFICQKLGFKREFVVASDLKINTVKEEKVLDIISALNGKIYYSGIGASSYQKEEDFTNRGIKLRYSNFKPFQYNQQFPPFDSNVCILDYLMNYGYDWDNVLKNQNL